MKKNIGTICIIMFIIIASASRTFASNEINQSENDIINENANYVENEKLQVDENIDVNENETNIASNMIENVIQNSNHNEITEDGNTSLQNSPVESNSNVNEEISAEGNKENEIVVTEMQDNLQISVQAEAEPTRTIEDGIYTISSAIKKSKVIDISCASTYSGANVQLWDNVNVSQQKFSIIYIGNGLYKIENMNSQKVLDVAGGGTYDGANVQQYDSNNTKAQQWIIKDCGDGYYNIISSCGGLYLDVECGYAANGSNIQTYSGNGSKAQKFKFNKLNIGGGKTIKSGTYIITSKLNNNKVLDISTGSKENGANLQLWDNANVKQQRYEITYLGNGFYELKSINSGKVLDVAYGEKRSGANVWQYQSNNSNAQQWIIKESKDGYYNIISRCNELYLDVSFGYAVNGANVQVYKGNGSRAQEFRLIQVETTGIDVSQFQGNIDWRSVSNSGVEFVMPRIGYRGYRGGTLVADSKVKENIQNAINNGIDCGGYFVTQAINYQEGVEEANFAIEQIRNYNITRPIAIDVEWAGGAQGNNGRADDGNISIQDRTQAIKGFCETIKNAGYTPMIYANKEWLTRYIDMTQLSSYNVWLAHYVKGAPSAKSDYTGNYSYWQYTSVGNVYGINGYVDMNKSY